MLDFLAPFCAGRRDMNELQDVLSKTISVANDVQAVEIDDEIVVYSPPKQSYFGIRGSAAAVLKILLPLKEKITTLEVLDLLVDGKPLSTNETRIILDGIKILIDLGIVREN